MAKKDVRPALEESLRRLQLDYVDLFLIHVPCGMKVGIILPKVACGTKNVILCASKCLILLWFLFE